MVGFWIPAVPLAALAVTLVAALVVTLALVLAFLQLLLLSLAALAFEVPRIFVIAARANFLSLECS